MKKNNITPEQEKITDTLHNLIWHRITHDDKYLEAIPERDSRDFHDYIYYVRYEFLEYEDSVLRAIVYLNGKHYEYTEAPQISNGIIWVNDIQDSEVEAKILELGGELQGELYEGFELYDPDVPVDEETNQLLSNLNSGMSLQEAKQSKTEDELGEGEYYDLPF